MQNEFRIADNNEPHWINTVNLCESWGSVKWKCDFNSYYYKAYNVMNVQIGLMVDDVNVEWTIDRKTGSLAMSGYESWTTFPSGKIDVRSDITREGSCEKLQYDPLKSEGVNKF